jgi:shikimate dehydrogenase
MHNAAFQATGLAWTYELLDIAPSELPVALARLREPEVAGANVTIPHRQREREAGRLEHRRGRHPSGA